MSLVARLGWMGAACMAAAPFVIDTPEGKLLAITGLALLMLQAIESRLWNLVALNSLGIIGYLYAFYF
tara:strand:- start:78 stop:281 length:204 start_codon:yes stop_codon:yes gene_type:complete